GAGRDALDRLDRPGPADRAHPALRGTRFPAPRVPRARPRPGTLPAPLCERRAAPPARQVRAAVGWVERSETHRWVSARFAGVQPILPTMTNSSRIELIGVPDFPLVKPGDDLAALVAAALEHAALRPATGDILVIAQKIVSKAEDRFVDLATVQPS